MRDWDGVPGIGGRHRAAEQNHRKLEAEVRGDARGRQRAQGNLRPQAQTRPAIVGVFARKRELHVMSQHMHILEHDAHLMGEYGIIPEGIVCLLHLARALTCTTPRGCARGV